MAGEAHLRLSATTLRRTFQQRPGVVWQHTHPFGLHLYGIDLTMRDSHMRVALIGGTGFVGHHLVKQLLQQGHTPVLLVRPGSEHRLELPDRCQVIKGSVDDEDAIAALLEGVDAVIFNIGILREKPALGITFKRLQQDAPTHVMQTALAQGVRRFLLMSANGIEARSTPYQLTKWAAEEALKQSGLDWTIFRPSVIFGDPHGRDEFASRLAHDVIDPPIPAPLFHQGLLPWHAGQFELAPVHVEDVARAFVTTLEDVTHIGKTYRLCGPENLTWKAILSRIAEARGRHKLMLPVPAAGVALAARLFERFDWFPLTRDQLTMLLPGNTCEQSGFRALGINPRPFDLDHLAYLSSLGK